MATDAMRFYTDLQVAEAKRPQSLTATHAIVGTAQPTATTARLAGGRVPDKEFAAADLDDQRPAHR
jgi:hypothetical protein